ncbi:MAG TPA: hypothetical protein VK862_01590 [Afifellaceae bacterium]|nr:hypothetical protein [Afifellaceae bacterium]
MHFHISDPARALAMTVAAVTVLAAHDASAKSAVRDMSLKPVTTQFDNPPHLLRKHDGSKYNWSNKGDVFHIKMRMTARGKGSRLSRGTVRVKNGGARTIWGWPAGYKAWKIDQVISATLGKIELGLFENQAVRACDQHGGTKKVVRNLTIPLEFEAGLLSFTGKTIQSSYPARIVCMPKQGPSRAPASSEQQRSPNLQVKTVKLYTIPAKPRCGRPVRLVTEIWTNRPDNVQFQLYRKDGHKQNASLKTSKVNGGFAARWAKTYTFEKSVDRAYMVVVKGHKFSTSWVPVTLRCGAGADHRRPGGLTVGSKPVR